MAFPLSMTSNVSAKKYSSPGLAATGVAVEEDGYSSTTTSPTPSSIQVATQADDKDTHDPCHHNQNTTGIGTTVAIITAGTRVLVDHASIADDEPHDNGDTATTTTTTTTVTSNSTIHDPLEVARMNNKIWLMLQDGDYENAVVVVERMMSMGLKPDITTALIFMKAFQHHQAITTPTQAIDYLMEVNMASPILCDLILALERQWSGDSSSSSRLMNGCKVSDDVVNRGEQGGRGWRGGGGSPRKVKRRLE